MAGPHSRPNPPAAPPADDPTLSLQTSLPSTIGPDEAAPPAADPPAIPRYSVGRRLGFGGMGVVYEAIGPVGVAVALKVIHPNLITADLRVRFRQEARAMMALDHPHLARIFDYGEADAGPYFTMRLLSGRTLADLRPAWARDPAAGLRTLLKAVAGVAYLHSKRLVHRDLKPSNILLDDADEPFVSDLGLVKELASGPDSGAVAHPSPSAPTPNRNASQTMTATGKAVGTRAYMAPEQAAADHSRIGPPTDVYALGKIAGEIAWGFRPTVGADGVLVVPGDRATSSLPAGAKVMLREILPSSDPPPPDAPPAPRAALPADVDAAVRRVVAKALAWDPAHRYPTAAEFLSALAAALEPAGRPPTRRRALAAGGVAVCGLGATLAMGPWWRRPPADPLALLQDEFRTAGEVELLREDGTWKWSEWLGGDGEWHPGVPDGGPADARGWFAVERGTVRLLELARGLPETGFRLVVKLAVLNPMGEAGVYAGRSEHPKEGAPAYCLIAAGLKTERPAPTVTFGGRSCPAAAPTGFHSPPPIAGPVRVQGPGPWVTFELDLDQDRARAAADGRTLGERTRNKLTTVAGKLGFKMAAAAAVTPTFHPAEGVGLFAEAATVAVRSARLIRTAP
jgi:hypothetical protein